MKSTKAFKETIKAYLDRRAKEDELWALAYAKPNKNIDDCISYILNTVKASGCNGFSDEEIFSMAIHYYDEDNLKVGKSISSQVVVNHSVELTDEEKEKAREDAILKHRNDLIAELQKKPTEEIKLSEEEKEQIRVNAIERATQEAIESMKKKRTKVTKKESETVEQASLF